jgi:hypothetical protein
MYKYAEYKKTYTSFIDKKQDFRIFLFVSFS